MNKEAKSVYQLFSEGGTIILMVYGAVYINGIAYYAALDQFRGIPLNIAIEHPFTKIIFSGSMILFYALVFIMMLHQILHELRKIKWIGAFTESIEYFVRGSDNISRTIVLTSLYVSGFVFSSLLGWFYSNDALPVIIECVQKDNPTCTAYVGHELLGTTASHYVIRSEHSPSTVTMLEFSNVGKFTVQNK